MTIVNNCNYISIIDCFEIFYQWHVHSKNYDKLTIVIHRNQEFVNVTIMKYRNSSAYVQKQIDKILRYYQQFAKTYVNNIVIFSKTLQKHVTHLRQIFKVLIQNNISINSFKNFWNVFFVSFLKQHVTLLKPSTDEQKLQTIINLIFYKISRS